MKEAADLQALCEVHFLAGEPEQTCSQEIGWFSFQITAQRQT